MDGCESGSISGLRPEIGDSFVNLRGSRPNVVLERITKQFTIDINALNKGKKKGTSWRHQ